jgi:S-adenosylmethionine:tRNA ribosyltransferase-isomerase
VQLADGTPLKLEAAGEPGERLLWPPAGIDVAERAHLLGSPPLPPYVRRDADAADTSDYQTVYARTEGSVAAPTAGLHFTSALLETIAGRGVDIVDVVLHVGLATFQPIRSDDPTQHRMHWERFEVEQAVLDRCDAARAAGGRVVAVGTTVVRVLESVAAWERRQATQDLDIAAAGPLLRGRTRLFLYPPHAFQRVDALITNFHWPRSTLLLLVDAFAGRETVRAAYAHAVDERYRFFSYGDAMWIE